MTGCAKHEYPYPNCPWCPPDSDAPVADVSDYVAAAGLDVGWVRATFPGLFQDPPVRPSERELLDAWKQQMDTAIRAVERMRSLPGVRFAGLLVSEGATTAYTVLKDAEAWLVRARETEEEVRGASEHLASD